MPRTTQENVIQVLGDDYGTESNPSPSLAPYVRWANLITTRVETCASRKGRPLTTEELREIETWLAAHAYQMSDKGYSGRSTLSASGQFQGQTGKGLEMTPYGQAAMTLDSSGCLQNIDKNQVAGMKWLGKPNSAAIDYADRN